MTNRRELLQLAVAGGLLGLTGCGRTEPEGAAPAAAARGEALEILILGGTGFIGPHMVERARANGHAVTLFNRGRTNPDRFPGVETLIGDRDGQLDALQGGQWDAVIDNSGYVPRHVRDSANLLRGSAGQYLFISTISAYQDLTPAGIDEDYPLGVLEDPEVEEVTGATYGPMKAACERAVTDAFPDGATIVRPGYIVGPGDRSDRWTYWPVRVAQGGRMIAPGSPDDPIQIIDARDLADFTISLVEERVTGTFNACGPVERLTMGRMLETIRETTASDAELIWLDAAKIESLNASFPIWNPPTGEYGGAHQVINARAIASGLSFRPLGQTVSDTLAWWNALDDERRAAMRSGLRVAAGEGLRPPPASIEEQMRLEAELLASLDA